MVQPRMNHRSLMCEGKSVFSNFLGNATERAACRQKRGKRQRLLHSNYFWTHETSRIILVSSFQTRVSSTPNSTFFHKVPAKRCIEKKTTPSLAPLSLYGVVQQTGPSVVDLYRLSWGLFEHMKILFEHRLWHQIPEMQHPFNWASATAWENTWEDEYWPWSDITGQRKYAIWMSICGPKLPFRIRPWKRIECVGQSSSNLLDLPQQLRQSEAIRRKKRTR